MMDIVENQLEALEVNHEVVAISQTYLPALIAIKDQDIEAMESHKC